MTALLPFNREALPDAGARTAPHGDPLRPPNRARVVIEPDGHVEIYDRHGGLLGDSRVAGVDWPVAS